jgi:hypothetical protein
MNLVRKSILPVVGVVAVLLIVALASPRAVHAVAATLVQITNTATNAVPTVAADNPALQPFAWTGTSNNGNIYFLFQTPADKRLVLETYSLECGGPQGSPMAWVPDIRLFLQTANQQLEFNYVTTVFNNNLQMISSQVFRLYPDPGTTVSIASGSAVPNNWYCWASVSGYLVKNL